MRCQPFFAMKRCGHNFSRDGAFPVPVTRYEYVCVCSVRINHIDLKLKCGRCNVILQRHLNIQCEIRFVDTKDSSDEPHAEIQVFVWILHI